MNTELKRFYGRVEDKVILRDYKALSSVSIFSITHNPELFETYEYLRDKIGKWTADRLKAANE